VLLAGLESIGGVILAGLIIGITANLAAYFLDPIFDGGVAQVLPFIIMIAILLIRPTGMFGWKTIDRI
jgi:branched-chain amino acid transport system permease protein